MIRISLSLNIVVLVPVCCVLVMNLRPFADVWGVVSPARSILLSIYISLLIMSVLLSIRPNPVLVAPLLATQVGYKVISPVLVGSLVNPIVISNIAIAIVHSVTLWLIISQRRNLAI